MVALAGLPNAGKSTLANALIGAKLSIVSHHPHTTRRRALGLCYSENTQLALCDTPGLSASLPNAMQRAMQAQLSETLHGVDLLVWILRVDRPLAPPRGLANLLQDSAPPLLLALNQIDRLAKGELLLPMLAQVHAAWEAHDYLELMPVSARRGTNLDRFKSVLARHAPHPCWLYDVDSITEQPERFYIAELVREKALWQTRDEVPHALGVSIERFEKTDLLVHIDALILVERDGQKMIVLGQGGKAIKNIGVKARRDLEAYFGRKVMLKLFVQVRQNWRNDSARIAEQFHSE